MEALLRLSLVGVSGGLGALGLVGLVLGGRALLGGRTGGLGWFLPGCALLAVLSLGLAYRLLRLRDPQRRRQLALGILVGGVTTLACLGVLELALARLRPAVTFRRAQYLSPPIFRRSDILPLELRPGYHAPTYMRESGVTIDFRVNELGYRGAPFTVAKPAGTYRILVLGDSFAVNLAVPEEFLHTVVLERLLNESGTLRCRIQVINAGYADGYSPDAYVAYMLQKGFALDPDLVVAQYFVLNDFKDLLETEVLEWQEAMPLRVRSRSRYVDESGRFRSTMMLKYRLPILRDSHLFLHLWDLLRLDVVNAEVARILDPDYVAENFASFDTEIRPEHVYADARERPHPLQEAFDRSMEYVRLLDREVHRRGVEFVLFVVPSGEQTSPTVWEALLRAPPPQNWERPNPQAQIAGSLEGTGIRIFDPLERYREQVERETLYIGENRNGHWNERGSAFTARILQEFLLGEFEPFQQACLEPGAHGVGDTSGRP